MRSPSTRRLRVLFALLGGCKSSGGHAPTPPGIALGSLTVTSTSFPSSVVPIDFTCDGADRSPQLTWSAPPEGTQSFALVCDDPDASGGTFTHWIAYDLRGDLRALPEGADPSAFGGAAALNDFKRAGYAGPCPPRRELHHYSFRVYALNARLNISTSATREDFEGALRAGSGHVLAEGALVATFAR
ncbi:MAG: YbhB/YbcL family Raf kinase inhibitor-like protein [Myxococcota bacterium]|nr:YbhB/YbcL family Raf kinase inhibitor-like protein [Myxococcota bacterium]